MNPDLVLIETETCADVGGCIWFGMEDGAGREYARCERCGDEVEVVWMQRGRTA